MSELIMIATRESKLAMAQAEQVAALLGALPSAASYDISIFARSTKGDAQQEGNAFAEWGYKGLFTKEIDAALLAGDADIAVHSMKDMPSILPDGLCIAAVLKREDVRDAFLSPRYASIAEMPAGAVVGTASLRRGSQIKMQRPDLKVVPFRGNVQTRLKKLKAGEVDATLLAIAGLNRLGLEGEAARIIPETEMLPAVAQGTIAITCRSDDAAMCVLIAELNHEETRLCVTAERAMLRALDGSCRTPIAGHAALENGTLTLRGLLCHPSGKPCFEAQHNTNTLNAEVMEMLGKKVGESLSDQADAAKQNFREWCKG